MREKVQTLKLYTVGEEIFNSVSHGVGTLLSVIGTTVLVVFSSLYGGPREIIVSLVYGLSLVLLYTMSTLYHAFTGERVKRIFRIFDHSTIFLLIAGSYTPFMLLLLKDSPRAAVICGVIWALSILGIVLNCISIEKFEKLSMVLYVAMGWAVLLVLRDVLSTIAAPGFWLLITGGLCYTGGIAFYKMNKVRYMHSVWHLFVLAGSIFQYFAILLYVIPGA